MLNQEEDKMMKKVFLILVLLFIVFVSNSIAQSTAAKKIYIIGDASVLSGLNIYDKDSGNPICHAEMGDDGKLNPDAIFSEEEIFKIVTEVIVKVLKDINIQAEPVWTKVQEWIKSDHQLMKERFIEELKNEIQRFWWKNISCKEIKTS